MKFYNQLKIRFFRDINNTLVTYDNLLLKIFEINHDYAELYKCVFDIFFYEKIYQYEQNKMVHLGIHNGVKMLMSDIEAEENINIFELESSISERLELYMNSFSLPDIDDLYAGKELYKEVMALEDSNEYKQKPWYALLFSLYEGLNNSNKMQMISEVLVYYDSNYKISDEEKKYTEQRLRIKNKIPDFSNVKEGDVWEGERRFANFVRDLGLKYYKAQSNGRNAQINSINKSCKWEDDKKEKRITLIEIYTERLSDEEKKRTGKYENEFKTILLYLLKCNHGEYITTNGTFFKNTNVISREFNTISIDRYVYKFNIPESKIDELKKNIHYFYNIDENRLKEIFDSNVKPLEKKKIIKTKRELVIAKGSIHIPLSSIEQFGLSMIEVESVIEDAYCYAFSRLHESDYNSIEKNKGREKYTTLFKLLSYKKQKECKKLFEKYISDNYGWSYVYEQVIISAPDAISDIVVDSEQYDEARNELRKKLKAAVKKTAMNKYNNKKLNYEAEEHRIENEINKLQDIKELINL